MHFALVGALNLGYSGGRSEHVVWRLRHGEWPEDLRPDTVVLLIGAMHPNARGYDLWAEAMVEILDEVRAP